MPFDVLALHYNIEFHIRISFAPFEFDFSRITVAMWPICFLLFCYCYYCCRCRCRFSYVILAALCDSCFPFLDQCLFSATVRSYIRSLAFRFLFIEWMCSFIIPNGVMLKTNWGDFWTHAKKHEWKTEWTCFQKYLIIGYEQNQTFFKEIVH